MHTRTLQRHAIILLTMAATLAFMGCQKPGGDPTRLLPLGADMVAVAPTVSGATSAITGFLEGIEGASGGIELLAARTGADIGKPDALSALGVDVSKPLAFAMLDGGSALAVGVKAPDEFISAVSQTLKQHWHLDASAPVGEGEPYTASLPNLSLAFGVTSDRLGVVTWQSGKADAAALFRRLVSGGGGLMQTEAASEAVRRLGASPGLWVVLGGPPTIPPSWGLGPAAALLVPFTSGLTTWSGSLKMEPTRLSLDLRGQWTLPGEFDVAWFRPETPMVSLASVASKSQTLWGRLRLNFKRLRTLPTFIRKRILTKTLPGPLGSALPSAEALIDLLSGDIAVAVLGVDKEATVDHFIAGALPADRLPQLVHLGAFLGVTDVSKADAALGTLIEGLKARGYAAAPLQLAGLSGWAIERSTPQETWTLIRKGRTVGILSGKGEVARLHDVQEGKATSLKDAGYGERASQAIEDDATAIGLHASFRRITRELNSKGVPPYFLKVMNDIKGLSGSIRPDAKGVDLSLEVQR